MRPIPRARVFRTICELTAILAVAGCSSSTDPGGAGRPAQLTSTIVASSSIVKVGQTVTAQWTIENASSEAYHHAFGFSNNVGYALEISVMSGSSLESQGSDLLFSQNDSLNLPPRGKFKLNAIFKGVAVGIATLKGCLPPDSTATEWTKCATTDVRVVSGF